MAGLAQSNERRDAGGRVIAVVRAYRRIHLHDDHDVSSCRPVRHASRALGRDPQLAPDPHGTWIVKCAKRSQLPPIRTVLAGKLEREARGRR